MKKVRREDLKPLIAGSLVMQIIRRDKDGVYSDEWDDIIMRTAIMLEEYYNVEKTNE